jgi:hypothetical protein
LAAAAADATEQSYNASDQQVDVAEVRVSRPKNQTASQIFKDIVGLRVGEALLFSPSAIIGGGVASDSGCGRLGTAT